MTDEQQERLESMNGQRGAERHYEAILERTLEVIDLNFSLYRIISGGDHVSILKGNNPQISYMP